MKLLSLLMLQQLLLSLHVIWVTHLPAALCPVHAAVLLAVVPAAVHDLLRALRDALVCSCLRWLAVDQGRPTSSVLVRPWLHVCGRLVQPGLRPVGITAPLDLLRHRLLLGIVALLVVLQVIMAMQVSLGGESLL